MALRITCPQGHLLSVREEFRGKTIRCPTCQALMKVSNTPASSQSPPKPAKQASREPLASPTVKSDQAQTMQSVVVVKCPSGHQLKVKSQLMGKQVRCPKCKQTFTVLKGTSPTASEEKKASPIQTTPGPSASSTAILQPAAEINPIDPLPEDPFNADPLSAATTEQFSEVEGFGDVPAFDVPAFDDTSGFGDIPAFDDGLTVDNLPAFDADPLAAPANVAPGVTGGNSPTGHAQAFPGQKFSASGKSVVAGSVEPQEVTNNHAPNAGIPWKALAAGVAFGLMLLFGEGILLFGLGSKDAVDETTSRDADSSAATEPQPHVVNSVLEPEREVQPRALTFDPSQGMRQEQELHSVRDQEMERGQEDQRAEGRSPPPQPILAEIKSDISPYTLVGSAGDHLLPTKTWSIAYDKPTGRIALTLDRSDGKSGAIAVYEMDGMQNGRVEPVAAFETPNLPTAVVIKPWKGKRLYAVACNQSAKVWLYDVDSLQPVGQLLAGGSEIIDIQDLGSSRDPDDPYLYFAALQSSERHGRTYKANVVGRFDLSSMKLESKTEPRQPGQSTTEPDGRVDVSADGSTLFGKDASYRYEKLAGDGAVGKLTQLHTLERYEASRLIPGPFGIQTLASNRLCSRDLFVTDNTGVQLLDSGKQNAILLGLENLNAKQGIDPDARIKIISANNYKVHASEDFKYSVAKSTASHDPRAKYHAGHWGFLDETRQLAIVATNQSILVWRDLLQSVPKEPWLTVTADFPDEVSVGKEISIPLKTPSGADVTYELIDESPYDVEEKKETDFGIEVSYRDSHTIAAFLTYKIPDGLTLSGNFEIVLLLQTPDGKWTRQYTTSEATFSDNNNDGKIDRTDDESNPDRKVVAIETVTANNDMSLTFKPISDAIRPTLKPRTDGSGRVYQYSRTRPVRAAVCVTRGDDTKDITAITKVATMNFVVTDRVALMKTPRNSITDGTVPKPKQPLQNRLRQNDFRRTTKFVSPQDSPLVIAGNSLTWTPSAKQIGKRSLGIRVRSGELVKDTYFGVNIEMVGSSDTEALPFYVNGISFQRDSDLAVIWGNDSDMAVAWEYSRKTSNPPAGIKFMVGVYDWRQGKVLRHQEFPTEIEFAAISPSGICATVPNPPRLVRLDYQTLKPIKQVPLQDQSLRIAVVADKYVATTSQTNSERFELPSLKPIQPGVSTTSAWLAEDFGDGWMWEGVHWDKSMREPKLLAMPIAFGVGPDRNTRGHISGFERAARMEPSGPVLLTLHDTRSDVKGLPLPIHPCRLLVKYEQAAVTGELFFEHNKQIRKVIRPASQAPDPNARGQGSLFVSHGPEHSATIVDGKIRLIPYSLWELPEIGFNFQPVQSTFLLNPSRPTDVQYSAPGAVKYRLRLMSGYTNGDGGSSTSDSNAKVLFDGESTDGSFQTAFESIEPLVEAARKAAGINVSSYRRRNLTPEQQKKTDTDALVAYGKQVTGAYRSLAGRAPRNTPVPVYAYVSAENAAGEKAALFHAYLVDVDANQYSE